VEPVPPDASPFIERRPRAATSRPQERPAITYRDIRAYVYARHSFSPRTGWIAHVKELNGLLLRPTHNRRGAAARIDACPPERQAAIVDALRHFGILEWEWWAAQIACPIR